MKKPIVITAASLAILAAAVFLRLGQLDLRPMHGDEAVNAFKFADLQWGDGYRYDPHEFHGPTLPYLTLPAAAVDRADSLAATDVPMYRSTAVAAGLILVLLTLIAGRAIGWPAALWAAFFCALSPAMVFFSRYYIHEMPLVVFTAAALLCGAGWARASAAGRHGLAWAAATGLFVGLMHATKETFALTLVAAACGLLAATIGPSVGTAGDQVQTPINTIAWPRRLFRALGPARLTLAALAALLTSVTLFSSFFTNLHGPLDSILTYLPWLTRGVGRETPHIHEWWWYAALLTWWRTPGMVWTELAVILLALLGSAAAWTGRTTPALSRPVARFLVVYAAALFLTYSAIPYKTPWSILTAWHALILLAGLGAASLIRLTPSLPLKFLVTVAVLAAAAHLAWQADRAAHHPVFATRNPWVYAHPTRDAERLGERAAALAAVSDFGPAMPVMVIKADHHYWPLPFHLRSLTRVGYYTAVPDSLADPALGMVIVDEALSADARARLGDNWVADSSIRLPPDIHMMVYIRADLWDRFMSGRR